MKVREETPTNKFAAQTGEGIEGAIPKPWHARPQVQAYVGRSGFYVSFQLNPLIPAKAGIQEIIPNLSGPVTGSRPTPG